MKDEVRRVDLEHRHLDAEAAALQTLLDNGREKLPVIFVALSTFANALAEHLVGEHEVLNSAITRRPDCAEPSRAEMEDDLRALSLDWSECLSRWTEDQADAAWEPFRDQLSTLLVRIRQRVALESSLLRH